MINLGHYKGTRYDLNETVHSLFLLNYKCVLSCVWFFFLVYECLPAVQLWPFTCSGSVFIGSLGSEVEYLCIGRIATTPREDGIFFTSPAVRIDSLPGMCAVLSLLLVLLRVDVNTNKGKR